MCLRIEQKVEKGKKKSIIDFKGGGMKRVLRRSDGLWMMIVVAAFLSVSGCSGDSPLAPEYEQAATLVRPGVVPAGLDGIDCPVNLGEIFQNISPMEGGIVPLCRGNYHHSFEVPAGALRSNTVITAMSCIEVVAGKNAVAFTFGPSGLIFEKAAYLAFDMAEINSAATTANLYYYDPSVRAWILQSKVDVKKGVAVFEIYHFSKYAIAD